jgi:hypothetical protein
LQSLQSPILKHLDGLGIVELILQGVAEQELWLHNNDILLEQPLTESTLYEVPHKRGIEKPLFSPSFHVA